MRVFLDTNVLVSAFATRGLCVVYTYVKQGLHTVERRESPCPKLMKRRMKTAF